MLSKRYMYLNKMLRMPNIVAKTNIVNEMLQTVKQINVTT